MARLQPPYRRRRAALRFEKQAVEGVVAPLDQETCWNVTKDRPSGL